jgi:hypothetical protein
MPRIPLSLATAAAAILVSLPAFAGTLRCTQINGNLNCAGSGAVSCQTVNGHTVCSNGSHDVVQSFGGAANDDRGDNAMDDDPDDVDAMPMPRRRHSARPYSSDR